VGSGEICISQYIDYADLPVIDRQIADSASWILLRVVGRSQNGGVLIDEIHHVHLVVYFFSTGDHIYSQFEKLHAVGAAQAEPVGGSFAVGDYQINLAFQPQRS